MKSNRALVQGFIGLSEGGYINHPKDPGGATDRGITQATFNAYLRRKRLPQRSVRGITKAVAEEIIFEQYMRPVMFDDLPSGLDYAMADYAVHSGPARAVKELQRIVGVTDDGVMGDRTLAAVLGKDAESLIVELCKKRMRFLRSLKTIGDFGSGWTARVMGSQDGLQEDDIGVLDRSVMMHRGERAEVIPEPGVHGTAKADPADVSNTSAVGSLLKDPVALIPVVGGLAPLLNGTGPVQIALAVAIVAVVSYLLFSRIKKERRDA